MKEKKLAAAFGGSTLAFLMVLVLFRPEVPQSARFIIVAIIGLGLALAAGFIGGTAEGNGGVALPGNNNFQFNVGGGLAAFFITLVLGYIFYVRPPDTPEPGPCPNISGDWLRQDNEVFHIEQTECKATLTMPHSVFKHIAHFDIDKTGSAFTLSRTDPDGNCTAAVYIVITIDNPKHIHQVTKGTDGKCNLPSGLTEDYVWIKQ